MACNNCTSTSTSNTGCNCGSLGCPVSVTDKCVTTTKALDVCGDKTIPAGTSLDTVLKDSLATLCTAIEAASSVPGPTGPAGATGATGAAGADGADGKGITSIVDNGDGTMTITYTDASTTIIPFIDTNKYHLLFNKVDVDQNTTITPTALKTYTLPASTLSNDGDYIKITANYWTPSSSTSYGVSGSITIGGVTLIIAAWSSASFLSAVWEIYVTRISATSISYYTKSVFPNGNIDTSPVNTASLNLNLDQDIISYGNLAVVASGTAINSGVLRVEHFKQ